MLKNLFRKLARFIGEKVNKDQGTKSIKTGTSLVFVLFILSPIPFSRISDIFFDSMAIRVGLTFFFTGLLWIYLINQVQRILDKHNWLDKFRAKLETTGTLLVASAYSLTFLSTIFTASFQLYGDDGVPNMLVGAIQGFAFYGILASAIITLSPLFYKLSEGKLFKEN